MEVASGGYLPSHEVVKLQHNLLKKNLCWILIAFSLTVGTRHMIALCQLVETLTMQN